MRVVVQPPAAQPSRQRPVTAAGRRLAIAATRALPVSEDRRRQRNAMARKKAPAEATTEAAPPRASVAEPASAERAAHAGPSGAHYIVLARKYRPTDFGDLIGQDAMVTTLRNAFATDRIAQGYMLTGVR